MCEAGCPSLLWSKSTPTDDTDIVKAAGLHDLKGEGLKLTELERIANIDTGLFIWLWHQETWESSLDKSCI